MVAIDEETKFLVEEILNKFFNVPFRIDKAKLFIFVLIGIKAKVEF